MPVIGDVQENHHDVVVSLRIHRLDSHKAVLKLKPAAGGIHQAQIDQRDVFAKREIVQPWVVEAHFDSNGFVAAKTSLDPPPPLFGDENHRVHSLL